jgi:hypothetical protein
MDLTVGPAGADICGETHVAIQAALDRAAATGGGTVSLLPGTYHARDRIRVPSRTALVGAGDETILTQPDGWDAPLCEDGDWGNVWATVKELPDVRPGDGVHLFSDRDRGWNTTVATVLEVDGDRVRVDRRFCGNHIVQDQAHLSSAHSILDMEDARHVRIANLVIEGNRDRTPRLDGCRGGAVHGLRSRLVALSGVTVRRFNGDAFSFQLCDDWKLETCTAEQNAGHGLHPGSGSHRPWANGFTGRENGRCGLFVCWRVRGGVIENSVFERNTEAGISIGHKDSDNLFRGNRIVHNTGPGVIVRKEAFPMCPDRCVYEGNVLEGNGGPAQVVLQGPVADLVFRRNTYSGPGPRFEVGADVRNLVREPE